MKFICQKDILLKEISIAQDIISSKNTFSILSTLYLELVENTLTIKATDTKTYWTTTLPVEGAENGNSKVNYEKFINIIRNFPEDEVIFEQQDNEVMLRDEHNRINFTLKSIAKEDYPAEKEIDSSKYFTISQKDLNQMINQTIFAISNDETRLAINGALFQKEENKINMVGTNGKRMSCIFKEFDIDIPDFTEILIPHKILTLIKKLCTDEGSIDLAIEDNCLFVKVNNSRFYSNLIEGKFPAYKKVIPENNQFSVKFKRNDLMQAINRIDILVERNISKFYMNIQNNSILVSSEKTEYGEAKESIPCEYDGEAMTITLNTKFILEPLKAIESDDVIMEFNDPRQAIVLFAEPKSDYMHIVMPMQTN